VNPLDLLQDLVLIPAPPGQEDLVREYLAAKVQKLGLRAETDAKGNLIVNLGSEKPDVVVTAHMDEIAMIVTQVLPNGQLKVTSMGGLFPWKSGEGAVQILAQEGALNGVLSFGSMHTADETSNTVKAKSAPLTWEMSTIQTGLTLAELKSRGVRPGTRVVIHPSRRKLTEIGHLVAGYFLDDRADLVAWLLALEMLATTKVNVSFIATTSEEVGGEGACYYLQNVRPDVCVALELGANTPDAPLIINDQPTVWVKDAYAAMMASDGDLLASIPGFDLQFQALSRGGSDASCAASKGLCARPITLGIPMENTHGYEIIHPGAMLKLADLTVQLLSRL
jgi:putative aminopeptidase FrvX